MKHDLKLPIDAFDGELPVACLSQADFVEVFESGAATPIEDVAKFGSDAEEIAALRYQCDALQRRIDRHAANRQRLHALLAERTHELERIRLQGQCDPLTGVEGRERLVQRLPLVLDRAKSLGQDVGLIWLNVNGFSSCNERLGESGGDELLRLLARRISTHSCGADTVSRVGDDEFVVILPGMDRNMTQVAAEKIIRLARAPCTIGTHTVSAHMSAGVAVYPFDGQSGAELLRKAANTMRRNKPRFLSRRRLLVWPRQQGDSPA